MVSLEEYFILHPLCLFNEPLILGILFDSNLVEIVVICLIGFRSHLLAYHHDIVRVLPVKHGCEHVGAFMIREVSYKGFLG